MTDREQFEEARTKVNRMELSGWDRDFAIWQAARAAPAQTVDCAHCGKTFAGPGFCCERDDCPHASNRVLNRAAPAQPTCPDALLPDGPVCPRCGKRRGPSGIDGGSWVHY